MLQSATPFVTLLAVKFEIGFGRENALLSLLFQNLIRFGKVGFLMKNLNNSIHKHQMIILKYLHYLVKKFCN